MTKNIIRLRYVILLHIVTTSHHYSRWYGVARTKQLFRLYQNAAFVTIRSTLATVGIGIGAFSSITSILYPKH